MQVLFLRVFYARLKFEYLSEGLYEEIVDSWFISGIYFLFPGMGRHTFNCHGIRG